MGYYIETGGRTNKAAWLRANAKAVANPQPDHVPVVVMVNPMFEAAGVAFDQSELNAFTNPSDRRPKTVLYVPRTEVIRLCPHVADVLDW